MLRTWSCDCLQGRPKLGVFGVGEGDDGVEAVVAAGELDDDEDGVRAAGRWRVGAWAAVRLRKPAPSPRATRLAFRKSRRVIMVISDDHRLPSGPERCVAAY